MKKKVKLVLILMFLTAVSIVIVALCNPQLGFLWSNTITYTLYAIYFFVFAILFLIYKKI